MKAQTITGSILVPVPLPDGYTEADLDDLGASEVARVGREAGYATNAQAERVSDVASWLVGGDTVPRDDTSPAPPGAVACRVVTWQAQGERVDSPPAVAVVAQDDGQGRWVATVPGEVVALALLAVRHGLGSFDVRVEVAGADGRPLHAEAAIPISEDEVEVIVPAGARRVRVLADPVEEQDATRDVKRVEGVIKPV